ncbi:DUF6959 family protein [Pseudoalteromonas luteoviolacea]|uniref:Uncharacterized protein n=1 Tax=Pseudoalteromonas luteoviolacea (strain 2ta16) TaxID=1353533 RepID=V4HV39_PSEL2|nr:hypothetical protein [Pseudoalteromonas luteoviolacea]ESP93658.1 hypothetical protein PL2TA16_03044 [Pseudoalteromonas luteoviolacea 2ta16]KZN42447.1 hypothetical protein N483_13075 [Pseudoalteromonas luteoviolacea NCIMB 1944]
MIEVKCIKNVINSSIVQVEGREFPGVVIQGDTLYSLYSKSEYLLKVISEISECEQDYDNAEFLNDTIKEVLEVYELTMKELGRKLPYNKPEKK